MATDNQTTEVRKKNLFIKTWGCQMNVYDSNRIADVLKPLGYTLSEKPEDADMFVLNTCHIREKATEKVFSDLGRFKPHKEKREKKTGERVIMAVAGCVAQAEGKIITQRAPYVDLVFGPQTYHQLPEMVAKLTAKERRQKRLVNTDFPVEEKFDFLPQETTHKGASAFLSIQEGCDKFCTFCVVPYTRGAEYSRNVNQIFEEAQRLIDAGARDINLLGQNVNAFHGEGPDGKIWSLARLMEKLSDINGLDRIRYMTSHPRDMEDDLIRAHGELPKVMPFLHLPVQSGSDRILDSMNRQHTRELYFDIIEKLKKQRPDIALSSDFIVGFPGETEKDFEDTLDLVERVGYSVCYSFKYSARPGTPGASMQNLVREDVKSERLTRLQALLQKQQIAFNDKSVGKTVPVLFDRKGREDGQIHGRTPYMQAVHVTAPERLIGQIENVKIEKASLSSLTGQIDTSETILSKDNQAA